MEKNLLLEIINLHVEFTTEEGVVHAVKGINLQLFRGETLGIVGESGSGKSVSFLSVMQLIESPPGKIAEGKIIFHPESGKPVDLLALSEKEIQQYRGNDVAMIFQEPMTSLNPVYRCGFQVDEAILLHRGVSKEVAKAQTLELFEKVQLPDPERIYKSFPHQLSGGQKQRVMIAMAMSCNPEILIADEPTTALDVTVQKKILALMGDLKKELNASIIFITHDLGVIAEIADRVAVMYRGLIVEKGKVEDIFMQPQHPYTKSLLACRPPMDYRLNQLPVVADFMDISTDKNGEEMMIEKAASIQDIDRIQKITKEDSLKRIAELTKQAPLLEVKNLSCWFTTKKDFLGRPKAYVKAVDNVSFNVYPGETLGLVGESGCGKTTLGRVILRLLPARSGEVFYRGKDLMLLEKQEMMALRKKIQIIFQDPYASLNPRMTIGQAIMEPMTVHRIYNTPSERRTWVLDLLEKVGLKANHFNRYPHEFSGGQRQRICIARALALKPEFIICDESVSALDVSVQAQVLNLLLDLRESFQLSYIFISHDLSVVKFMSDRMLVMNQGKIVERGASDDIYHHPKNVYTQNLISAIPQAKNFVR